MTAPLSVADGGAAPSVKRNPWTNAAIIGGTEGLTALSKIGSKHKPTVKRLTQMMVWAKKATEEYFISRDTIVNTWAERDDNNEIKVSVLEDGKSQAPVMRNGIEYQLQASSLLRDVAKFEGDPPEPFSWEDFEQFQKFPDAVTIANLGPFAKIE